MKFENKCEFWSDITLMIMRAAENKHSTQLKQFLEQVINTTAVKNEIPK